MAEKQKLVKLPLTVWQVAKKAAIDKDEPLSVWLTEAILSKLERTGGEKK